MREPWIQTYSGLKFWPFQPNQDGITIQDIAHALSMKCRFGGHCRYHYSVAQHSVYVSYLVPEHMALDGLMHDAAEAYMPDFAGPVKDKWRTDIGWLNLSAHNLESVILSTIYKALDLPGIGRIYPMAEEILTSDRSLCHAERLQVMNPGPEWNNLKDYPPAEIGIEKWNPEVAEYAFIDRYTELISGKDQICPPNLSVR